MRSTLNGLMGCRRLSIPQTTKLSVEHLICAAALMGRMDERVAEPKQLGTA